MAHPSDAFTPFQQYCLSTDTFDNLYFHFESDVFNAERCYHAVEENLIRDFYKFTHDSNDRRIVSGPAQSERLLPEFCLARLIELRRDGVRQDFAIQSIVNEVKESDWEEGQFLASILAYNEPASSWVTASSLLVFLRAAYAFTGLDSLLNLIDSVPLLRTVIALAQSFVQLAIGLILMLHVSLWLFGFFSSWVSASIQHSLEQSFGGPFILWLLTKGQSWLPWYAKPFVQSPPVPAALHTDSNTYLTTAAAFLWNFSMTANELLNTTKSSMVSIASGVKSSFANQWPTQPNNLEVGLPSIPIKDSISMTMNETLYMSEVSLNFTALPILLHHSRVSILGASQIIRASSLESKDVMAKAYDDLTASIEALENQVYNYTTGVPDLIVTIERQLSLALSRIRVVQTPDLDALKTITYLSLTSAFLLIFYWYKSHRPRNLWLLIASSLCLSFSALATCKTSQVDSKCLRFACKYAPTLPTLPSLFHTERLEYRYDEAADSLWEFVLQTNSKMEALLETTVGGLAAAKSIEKEFDNVNILRIQDANTAGRKLEIIGKMDKCTIWNLNCRIGDNLPTSQRREQEVLLTMDLNQLNSLGHISSTAYNSFENAKIALVVWRRRIEPMLETLKQFKNPTTRHALYNSDNDILWHKLKTDVIGLEPLIATLREAYELQKFQKIASARYWERRSQDCRKRQEQTARNGQKEDMIDCLLEGLHIGIM